MAAAFSPSTMIIIILNGMFYFLEVPKVSSPGLPAKIPVFNILSIMCAKGFGQSQPTKTDKAIARQLYERRGFELGQQVLQKHKQRIFNILYYQLSLK